MSITVTQITAFLAVVRGGSVTAAADELMVTQPSVSAAVASLSRELGCDLFVRSGRGIELTDAGAAFAPYATEVAGQLVQGRLAAREAADAAARTLRICAVTTAAESFVPPLMRAFALENPDIDMTLDVANRQDVLERVLDRSADVAISGTPPEDHRLVAHALMDNEFVCIVSSDDPMATEQRVTGTMLAARPWLLREPGSGTRAVNERFLAAHRMRPATLTLGSNGAIKQAARAGLGVSLLSRAAVEAELASGLLREVRLEDPPPARPWFVLRSAADPVRAVVEDFVAFVRARWTPSRRTAEDRRVGSATA